MWVATNQASMDPGEGGGPPDPSLIAVAHDLPFVADPYLANYDSDLVPDTLLTRN
jgi:hypothetical protein